jgi:hypothetical protein
MSQPQRFVARQDERPALQIVAAGDGFAGKVAALDAVAVERAFAAAAGIDQAMQKIGHELRLSAEDRQAAMACAVEEAKCRAPEENEPVGGTPEAGGVDVDELARISLGSDGGPHVDPL